MELQNLNNVNIADLKSIKEVSKIKNVTVSAVHKAIQQGRLDYIRQGFTYLVFINNVKFIEFGK